LSNSPVPHYFAWWEMDPTNSIHVMPIPINAGDTIHPSATYISSSASYSLALSDLTNGRHYTEVTQCAANVTCSRQSAEWILERPTNGSYTPLADWGAMKLAGDKAADSVRGKSTPKPVL